MARETAVAGAVAHPNSAGAAEPVIETVPFPGLEEADWPSLLDGVDCVVHAAGLAHATETIPEERYRAVNTLPSLALAQAARGRVGRFVFLSSIRAQCGPTSDIVLTEDATARPTDAYGRSKLAAEAGLAALDLAAVSLRPVVVYGPGCKGNMAVLRRVALSGIPLPLGGLTGQRSVVSLDNVASAVLHALSTEEPLRGAMIVADAGPVTVPGMIRALREGAGLPARLFSIPEALIRAPLA